MASQFEDLVRARYERTVISGHGISHDGDCGIYQCKICTCGLLHLLRPYASGPDKSYVNLLYPDFFRQIGYHDRSLDHLHRHPAPEPTAEDVAAAKELLVRVFPGVYDEQA